MNSSEQILSEQLQLPAPWKFIFSGIICGILGTAAIIFNAIILIVVYKNKKLHTPCFYMIACQAAYGFIMGVSFVTDGIHRIGYVAGALPSHMTQAACLAVYWTKTISHSPSALITCCIGFDRLIAVNVSRTYYVRWANTVACCGICFSILIGFLHELIGVLTVPSSYSDTIACLNYFTALNKIFTIYLCAFDLTLFVSSTVIYGLIIVKVKRSFAFSPPATVDVEPVQRDHAPMNENETFMKKQMALMPLIKSIMAAYIVVGIAPQIMSSTAPYVAGGIYQAEIILYESILRGGGAVTDFLVLIVKCHEFRKSVAAMMSKS